MSNIVIRINGSDITDVVIPRDAQFSSAARGNAGQCAFRVRDDMHAYSFGVGSSITLDIDGVRCWGGYVAQIERGYFFEADCTCKTATVPRYLRIIGTDYNVLLQRRILYDKVDGTTMELTKFEAGTSDQEVLLYYLENHTDILDDGVTTSLIEAVASPYTDNPISGTASWRINDFCRYLTQNTGAIYYIDPDKVFVLTDVDTPNALKGISDDPDATEVGCRDLEIDFDGANLRNDALAWGVGQGPAGVPVFSRVQDEDSINEHGLWQVGDFNQAVWRQETVDRIADSYIYGSPAGRRGGKDDRVAVRCTVFDPVFRVAQKVAFRSEIFDFEDVIPIRSCQITFPTNSQAKFDLILSHEIDDPWSTFEFWFPPIPTFNFHIPEIDFDLPVNDPCREFGCVETFNRTVTTGLGSSEIGTEPYDIFDIQGISAFSVSDGVAVAKTTPPSFFSTIHYDGFVAGFWDIISPTAALPFTYRMKVRALGPSATLVYNLFPTHASASSTATKPRLELICDSSGVATVRVSIIQNNGTELSIGTLATGGTGTDWIWVEVTSNATSTQAKWWVDGDTIPVSYQVTASSNGGTPHPSAFYGWQIGVDAPSGTNVPFLEIQEIHVDEGLICTNGDPWVGTGAAPIWPDLGGAWDTGYHPGPLEFGDPGSFVGGSTGGLFTAGTWDTGALEVSGPATQIINNFANDTADLWEVRGDLVFLNKGNNQRLTVIVAGGLSEDPPPGVGFPDPDPINFYFYGLPTDETTLVWPHLFNGGVSGHTNFGMFSSFVIDYGFGAVGFGIGRGGTFGTTPFGVTVGTTYHFVVRVTEASTLGKIWEDGDPEPGWMAGVFGDPSPVIPQFGIGAFSTSSFDAGSGLQVQFSNLDVGVAYSNPCPGGANPCPTEWTNETLVRIDTPPGRPPENSYYQTTFQSTPGTMQIWVDGLLIRGDRFINNYYLKYVEILSSVDVGGGDVFNPSKTVSAYYYATCIHAFIA